MFPGALEFWDFLWIFVMVALAAGIVALWLKARAETRLAHLESKVDLLLERAGLARNDAEHHSPADIPVGVLEALQRGNKVEAIKRYRALTGVDLAEAKSFVDALEARKAS
jgi:ribosomal protein L7/L12